MPKKKTSLSFRSPFKVVFKIKRSQSVAWTWPEWLSKPRKHVVQPIPAEGLEGGWFIIWGAFTLRRSDW